MSFLCTYINPIGLVLPSVMGKSREEQRIRYRELLDDSLYTNHGHLKYQYVKRLVNGKIGNG